MKREEEEVSLKGPLPNSSFSTYRDEYAISYSQDLFYRVFHLSWRIVSTLVVEFVITAFNPYQVNEAFVVACNYKVILVENHSFESGNAEIVHPLYGI